MEEIDDSPFDYVTLDSVTDEMDDKQKVGKIVDYLLESEEWEQAGGGMTFLQFRPTHWNDRTAPVCVSRQSGNDPRELVDRVARCEHREVGEVEGEIYGDEVADDGEPEGGDSRITEEGIRLYFEESDEWEKGTLSESVYVHPESSHWVSCRAEQEGAIKSIASAEDDGRGTVRRGLIRASKSAKHTPSPSDDEAADDLSEPIDAYENTPRGCSEEYPPSQEEISAYLECSEGWEYDEGHMVSQDETEAESWAYESWCASAILFPSGNERLREKTLYRMAAVEVRHPDEILEEMREGADEAVNFQELCRLFEEEYGQSFRANLLHCIRANPMVPPEEVIAENCSRFAGEFGVILDELPTWHRLMTEAVVELYCRSD